MEKTFYRTVFPGLNVQRTSWRHRVPRSSIWDGCLVHFTNEMNSNSTACLELEITVFSSSHLFSQVLLINISASAQGFWDNKPVEKHSNFAVTLLYANAQSRRQGGRIKRFLPNLHAPKKSKLILPKLANRKYFRRCQLAEQGLVSILTSVDWAGKLPWFLFGDELQTFETTLTPGRCRERLIDCVRFSSFTCCWLDRYKWPFPHECCCVTFNSHFEWKSTS